MVTAIGIQKAVETALRAATSPETVVNVSGKVLGEKGPYVRVYVNDLFAVKVAIKASFDKEFAFSTTASELRKIMAIPGDVSFDVSDSPVVRFVWGQNELKLRKADKEMSEMRKPGKDAKIFCIPSAIIKQMCKDTLWVNEGNESFPNIRLKMEAKGGVGSLTVYAVDSKVVVKRQENFSTMNPDFEEIVDINARHLKTLLSTIEESKLYIIISDGVLFFQTESSAIDAKYIVSEHVVPDAERILSNKTAKYSVSFEKSEMLDKLRLASVFTGSDRTAKAVLSFLKDETRVEAITETGDFANMQVLSELSDDNACGTRAAFSMKLMQDLLRVYPDDTVKIEFTSETQPFWMCAEDGGEEDKSLLAACFMPLKI